MFSCRGQAGESDDLQFSTDHGKILFNLRTKLTAGKRSFVAVSRDGGECFDVRRSFRGEFSYGMKATFVEISLIYS